MVSADERALAAVPDPYDKESFLELQTKSKMFHTTSWPSRKFRLEGETRMLSYYADGKKKGEVPLAGAQVTKITNAHKKYCFRVDCAAEYKQEEALILQAHDDEDREAWVTAIVCAAKWDLVRAARAAIASEERAQIDAAEEQKRNQAKARKDAAVKRAQEVREKAMAASKLVKKATTTENDVDSAAVLAAAINTVAVTKMKSGQAETLDSIVTESSTRIDKDANHNSAATTTTSISSTANTTTTPLNTTPPPPLLPATPGEGSISQNSVTLKAELDTDAMDAGLKKSVEEARLREIRLRDEAAEQKRIEEEKRQERQAKIAAYRQVQGAAAADEAAAQAELEQKTLVHGAPKKKGDFNTKQKQMRDLVSLGDNSAGAAMTLEEKMAAIRKNKGKDKRVMVAPLKDPFPESEGWL